MPTISRPYPFPYPPLDQTACTPSVVRMPRGLELRQVPADELARIRRVFTRLLAVRVDNPDDAEDLVQETFLTMAARCAEVDIEKTVLVWGLGVLRRKVGNYYRHQRAQRRPGAETMPLEAESPEAAWLGPSAESTLHHAELEALLESILAQFPAGERVVLELMLSGLATNQIAEQLQPERYQNVVNWAHRGRRRLFKELARYGYFPATPRGSRRRAGAGRPRRSKTAAAS